MTSHRIKAVILRHFYEARRNLDRVTDTVYWPVIDVVIWGFFTVYLSREQVFGFTLTGFLLGAAILWSLFFSFQRDMAVGFLDELWSRNLLNLFSTPLTVWEYLVGLISVNFIKVGIGLSVSALLAWWLYAFNIFPFGFGLLPFVVNLVFFGLAVGIIITGFIFRYTTKIQGLAWSFAGLLQPFSCVFYPLSALPKFLRSVAWLLPTTHSFEGMRQVLKGEGFAAAHFWWGLGLNAVYFVIAIFFFKRIFEVTKKRGLLVKLE